MILSFFFVVLIYASLTASHLPSNHNTKPMKIKKLAISSLASIALSFICIQSVSSQDKFDYSRNGDIHKQVINSWNIHYRDYFASEIKRRLFQDNDVYLLYDIQNGGLQSFVEMTRRCKDTQQIGELVDLLSTILTALKPIPNTNNSTGWICSGGNICTAYGLLGKEVPLCSLQFLGLVGALSTSITQNIPNKKQSVAEKEFLANTFNTMSIQLNRWFTAEYFKAVNNRLSMTTSDINDGSSRYFFSDKDLWHLTVLSDLSELFKSGIQPATEDGKKAFEDLQNKKEGIKKIFDLFLARSILTKSIKGERAEIDKGYWKNFYDNRYAKYTGSQSPVSWEKGSDGEWKMITHVKLDSSYISNDVAWDISHSRRLVPALETFVRNRRNIKALWGYDNPAFDPIALRKAYANQIAEKIWNGDVNYPLFSNFWSGDNGWYRVAYAHQTGRRFIGYPPHGLSSSIPLGGYPAWGAFHPTLKIIFRNIYELAQTNDSKAKSFISENYSGLLVNGSNNTSTKPIQSLSFLSDLVE